MGEGVWQAVALSLQVAATATGVTLVPGVLLARWLAGRSGPVAWGVGFAVQLPLVLPPVVVGYGLLLLLPRSLAFTTLAAVASSAIVGLPLLVGAVRVAFEAVPGDLAAAARVDGATRGQAFRYVTLPLALRGVAAGAALHFARGLGEFGATAVVAGSLPGQTRTLPLALYAAIQQPGGERLALALVAVAVTLAALSLGVYALLVRRWVRI